MLFLNIIPGEFKKEAQLSNIYKLAKMLIALLSIALLLLAIIFLIMELMLQLNLITTVDETTLVVKNTENYTAKTREVNNQLDTIEKVQNDMVYWSYLLEFMSKNINGNISFSRITISKEKGAITLTGYAATRDDLLSLKKLIDESTVFTDVDFPIKNLLEKNNINFEISMKFKDYDFAKL